MLDTERRRFVWGCVICPPLPRPSWFFEIEAVVGVGVLSNGRLSLCTLRSVGGIVLGSKHLSLARVFSEDVFIKCLVVSRGDGWVVSAV